MLPTLVAQLAISTVSSSSLAALLEYSLHTFILARAFTKTILCQLEYLSTGLYCNENSQTLIPSRPDAQWYLLNIGLK